MHLMVYDTRHYGHAAARITQRQAEKMVAGEHEIQDAIVFWAPVGTREVYFDPAEYYAPDVINEARLTPSEGALKIPIAAD